jgi:dynein heavy chain, axonemal
MRVVQEEYVRQMKKCIVMKQMQDPSAHNKFIKMKVPVRLNKKTSPYFGVVRCPKYKFADYQNEILHVHWCSNEDMESMTRIFTKKCIEYSYPEHRYMLTDKTKLKLPNDLSDLKKKQEDHHKGEQVNVLHRWREFLVGEIADKLKSQHNFFEENSDQYAKSHLKRIILRFEFIMNAYLRNFVRQSIDDWVLFVKSFTLPKIDQNELWGRSPTPMLKINMSVKKGKDKKPKRKPIDDTLPEEEQEEERLRRAAEDELYMNRLEYHPTPKTCLDFMQGALDMIIQSTNKVNDLESDLMKSLQGTSQPNFPIDEKFSWVKDAQAQIEQMFEENIKEPISILGMYQEYEYLLNVNKNELVESLFNNKELKTEENDSGKADIKEIGEAIQQYHQAAEEIMNLSNDFIDTPMFRVECKKIKQTLYDQAIKIRDKLIDNVTKWCADTVNHIDSTFRDMQKQIQTPPTNEKELVHIREFITLSKDKTQVDLGELLKAANKHYELLELYSVMYKVDDIENTFFQKMWPMTIGQVIQDGKTEIANQEEIFLAKLEKEKDDFNLQLKEYEERFKKIKLFNDINQVNETVKETNELRGNIDNARDKIEQFNEREITFSQQATEWPGLDTLDKEFKPFYDLLDTSFQVTTNLQDWTNQPLANQDYEQMEASINQWFMQCFQLKKKLSEDYPDTADVADEVRKRLDAFRENLPLIKCITSEAITEEDWNEIKTLTKRDDLERDTITVINFADFQLHDYLAEIDEITSRAEKKFQLAKKLQKMKLEMKDFKIMLHPYKGKTFVIKNYDDINSVLDDQIVATQAMLGSSNMRGKLKVETRNWEVKLNQMSELIGEVAKCQRTWMYLEPIFASDDIGKTMPNEASMFKDVDTTWKTTMETIETDPGILDLNDRDNITAQFFEANKKLDQIQNKLDAYLEEKSLVFPRFYFLDSQSLLMLLAQTKDPRAVQVHMDKCFEGISRVKFSDKDEIYGMLSAEGEDVDYKKSIDVNAGDKKGNVEKWMLEIETVMRMTLKQLTSLSMHEYYTEKRTKWVENWPGQIVLAVDQVDWTTGVEKAIVKENGLTTYFQTLLDQVEDVVQLVRGELSAGFRITLKAMVVIDVHARDVVQMLVDEKVTSVNSFAWASQLRYYWTEKDLNLEVAMVTAKIPYGFEYLGNSLRLVITPLTDRCYRTLMGAKQLNYGGAPEGPAGTGKTESVKDLAKALAVQCVVFNCSPDLGYQAVGKFFKGLASSGCWNCFDEFNRIDLEVLSVIAQQVMTIQTAIMQNLRTFVFEGTQLKLNRACSVNITMNPGYAGRAELPDNLKALFRPCAMMVPDYVLIGEIELYSFGFSRARYIAIKVVASLQLSSEQLSSQDHYDFGMRSLKAILTACGNLRRQLDWPEDQIGLRALNDVNLPKFTQNDIPLYNGITNDLFPGVVTPAPDYTRLISEMEISCKTRNLQPKTEFLKKCIELYETIMVRHGLMVVGGAFSGKSMVIKTLQDAMS